MIGPLFFLAGCLLLLLALHPFTLYPASLYLMAKISPTVIAAGSLSRQAALCVCAYNEEKVIRAKIENMLSLAANWPELEVLVYVDGASDGTAEIVKSFDHRVRLVASPVRMGKTHGMNTLVAMTQADYLIFTDANVTFAPEAIARLLMPFGDPAVGCVCGHLVYTKPGDNVTAATGSLYWRLEERIKADESATGSVIGADGSIFALRRSLHTPPPPDLIDDMYVSLKVLCQGSRIVRVADAYAYEEAVSNQGEEFRRKIRIACQAFNVHRALWGELRRNSAFNVYKYVSHKLIRWLTIYLLSIGVTSLVAGAGLMWGWMVFLGLLLGWGCGVAAVLLLNGPFTTLRDIFSAFLATGIGVWRSIKGERFQTWNPPTSSRVIAARVEEDSTCASL